ncbi:hypothetical protein IEQ34_004027 [Dendrobium chrysotoxum]|uniref:Uncharacterized protein n=1 Tax=Dendrobium chrysotoxum TaxID=161865 RepID=A0AAV7HG37_DENCH|nr:hypothetical protein IEQ34_004027 [Dendrobium chrysotoxum]
MGPEYSGQVCTQGFGVTLTRYFPQSTSEASGNYEESKEFEEEKTEELKIEEYPTQSHLRLRTFTARDSFLHFNHVPPSPPPIPSSVRPPPSTPLSASKSEPAVQSSTSKASISSSSSCTRSEMKGGSLFRRAKKAICRGGSSRGGSSIGESSRETESITLLLQYTQIHRKRLSAMSKDLSCLFMLVHFILNYVDEQGNPIRRRGRTTCADI